MAHVIIIEGPDGAGKTRLAARLMLQDFRYAHEGPTPDDVSALQYYGGRLHRALANMRDTVLDRFHLGAYVYGPIFRHRVELTDDELRVMDRLITARGVQLVIALPPYEVCIANWAQRRRHEMIRDESTFRRVYDRFVTLARRYPTSRWDYTKDRSVIDDLLLRRPRQKLPADAIGSPTARYLIVGERTERGFDIPFFSMSDSSGYLNRALWRAGYRESDLAFMNTFQRGDSDIDCANDISLVMGALSSIQRVILLGKSAQRVYNWDGLATELARAVPHPQYWKRFHHHDPTTYVRLLREARR